MSQPSFDFQVLVIGAGPGGYVCAIRCAQLGLRTALIERDAHLGGTCLNVGCIPSKALLHSTHLFHTVAHHGAEHGIATDSVRADVAALMQRKSKVVDQLRSGVAQLVQKRGIERIHGAAQFVDAHCVEVTSPEGASRRIAAERIVIATGSEPTPLPFLPFDGQQVVSSTEAIAFDAIPKSLAVIGAGAIGLEIGSIWARLGTEVTVIEFLPTIAAGSDEDISKLAERIFKKQGLKFSTNTKVLSAQSTDHGVVLSAERKGKALEFTAEKVLVAVGRRPFTSGLNLEAIGLQTDERGRIPTQNLQSAVPSVFAIGDVTTGPMLAHKAEEDGVALAESFAGLPFHLDYSLVPGVIYTDPEIASIGLTERQAAELHLPVKVGKFDLRANGRAIAQAATDGTAKIIAHADSDRLLGATIIAQGASEMIAALAAHMEYGGSAEDLARTIHAHPTISEAIKEAALAVDHAAIHAL